MMVELQVERYYIHARNNDQTHAPLTNSHPDGKAQPGHRIEVDDKGHVGEDGSEGYEPLTNSHPDMNH